MGFLGHSIGMCLALQDLPKGFLNELCHLHYSYGMGECSSCSTPLTTFDVIFWILTIPVGVKRYICQSLYS